MNCIYKSLIKLLVPITVLTFICSGCALNPLDFVSNISNNRRDKNIKKIIQCIEVGDKAGLRAMFSEETLAQCPDYETGETYLFDLISEPILSWEHGASVESLSKNEKTFCEGSKRTYYVETQNGSFIFFIIETRKDMKNDKNAGLYMLQVFRKDQRELYFDWGNEKQCVGIWYPGCELAGIQSVEQ